MKVQFQRVYVNKCTHGIQIQNNLKTFQDKKWSNKDTTHSTDFTNSTQQHNLVSKVKLLTKIQGNFSILQQYLNRIPGVFQQSSVGPIRRNTAQLMSSADNDNAEAQTQQSSRLSTVAVQVLHGCEEQSICVTSVWCYHTAPLSPLEHVLMYQAYRREQQDDLEPGAFSQIAKYCCSQNNASTVGTGGNWSSGLRFEKTLLELRKAFGNLKTPFVQRVPRACS